MRPLFWLADLAPPLGVELRRSQAHRATAIKPTTQIRAQRRAARTTTKSGSTATGSGGSAADSDAVFVVVEGEEEEELKMVVRNLMTTGERREKGEEREGGKGDEWVRVFREGEGRS